jgi:hypothetical protein
LGGGVGQHDVVVVGIGDRGVEMWLMVDRNYKMTNVRKPEKAND